MSLLEWLSPLKIEQQHRDLCLNRVTGIYSWFLKEQQFLSWRDGPNSPGILACKDRADSGDGTLTSVVIDHLYESVVTDDHPRAGILYFYSDYLDPGLQTPLNALGSLLRQFGTKWPAEMDGIMQTRGIDRHDTSLTCELAVELFSAALKTLDEVFICLYGMEFWEKAAAQDFLQTLYESFYGFHGGWKLFSSPAGWRHQDDLERFLGAKSDSIYFAAKDSDTAKYIKYWMEKDDSTAQMDGKFLEELSSCLHKFSHQQLLMTDLQLRILLLEPTLFKRRRFLLSQSHSSTTRVVQNTFARLQQLPNSALRREVLKTVYGLGIVPVDKFRGIYGKANITIPSTDDSFEKYLNDNFLGLLSLGKTSRTIRPASQFIWSCLKGEEEFKGLAPDGATSKRNIRPSAVRNGSKDTYLRHSSIEEGNCTYTYTYGYDKNGEPDVNIDVDYDPDIDLDGYDSGDHYTEGHIGQDRKSQKRVREEDELQDSILSSITTQSPNVQWDQVAGLEVAKEALKEATILPLKFPSLYASNRRRSWSAVLLYGPPGTGKTLLAKAVATEAQRTFFSISAGDLLSKWYGQTEKLIRQLFILARRRKPSVIFVDEIDSIGTSRDTEHHWFSSAQTELFVQLDGVASNNTDVLLMAATNVPWHLDSSLRRRFDRRVYIPLPDSEARARIFQKSLSPHATGFADFEMLADLSDGFSGSDISAAVQEILMRPVRAIVKAKHFKKDEDGKFTPCARGDAGAIAMTYREVPHDMVVEPPLQMIDYIAALKAAKKSVDQAEIQRFEKWTDKFGIGG